VDGKHVFTLSREGQICAFDAPSGKPLWNRQAGNRPPMWGYASSPLVVGNAVIVNTGGAGVAFNKSSGLPLWGGGDDPGYASVVPVEPSGKGTLLVFAAKALMGINSSGKMLWGFPWPTQLGVNAADPVVVNASTVFITSDYGKGCALVSIKGAPKAIWQNTRMKCHYSSPVLYKDALYGLDEATLRCLDLKTGEVKWSRDGFGKGGISIADGKLLILTESGDLVIAEANSEAFKEISRVKALGGQCWTSPVLANGRIYCRSGEGVIACVDVRGK
jgi:outer membrane protein assembly factor BamB